jgi:hypothetical protein
MELGGGRKFNQEVKKRIAREIILRDGSCGVFT